MTSVLVLDDELGPRTLLAMALRDIELSVETAASGEEALAMLSERQFDWIVSDIYLGDGDGIELAGRFRELAPDSRIVLMSAIARDEDVDHLNIAGFWRKPFDPFDLRDFIRGEAASTK
jgi:CheY-like chemotaxis protein